MKKYLLAFTAFILSLCIQAQDDITITGTNKITKKATPQQIIDSLNKRFPNAKSIQYYKPSAAAVKKGWEVSETDNLQSGDELQYYTLSFKRDDFKYYGLYKADGTLVRSKVEEQLTKLPDPINSSLKNLGQAHPGYKVVSKTYYKNKNWSKEEEYYEVVAKNGSKQKRLFYAADGTLKKVKD